MKKVLTLLFAFVMVFAMLFTSQSHALLIDRGIFSEDTANGLDWLELTQTAGRSWGDVESNFGIGGDYEGWRYATGSEFDVMVTGMGGTPTGGSTYIGWGAPEGLVEQILTHLGNLSLGLPNDAQWHSFGMLADEASMTFNTRWTASLDDARVTTEDWIKTYHNGGYNSTMADVNVGSFLVRSSAPVPEPATIALLGIGLAGLAGAEVRRRRKKKALDKS